MSAPIPAVSTSPSKIGRQSGDFHPNLWENDFLSCPNFKENDQDNKKLLELKQKIERMLMANVTKPSEKLDLIDAIQRLGISYHFKSEIDEILEKIYKRRNEYDLKNDYDDLNSISLRFQLLRQHGYRSSSEVFNKFKGINGKFKESLATDVKGLLSLYEASHLRVHGEDILDEALDFTTRHLQSMATRTGNKSSLAKQIHHALKRPLRKDVPRIEARFYIHMYQEDPLHDEAILTFAVMDFNILQKLYQKELSDIIRWWKELDLKGKLTFARDRIVEVYFWTLGMYFEPKYSWARRILTKVGGITSIIDDTYDVYGTIEELEIFTEAVESWDIRAMNELPQYMKQVYEALLDVYKEIEKDIAFGENSYRLHYAKEAMKYLVRSYYTEAKWCHQKHLPTMEEYMEVASISSTFLMFWTTSLVGMGDIVTKEAFEWIFSYPKILKASLVIGRLMNDIASHKRERKREHVASAVECYMKQHGISEEKTKQVLLKEIEYAWKDMNEDTLGPTVIPMTLLDPVVNLARMTDFSYKDEKDYYTDSHFIKNHYASILKDPLLL